MEKEIWKDIPGYIGVYQVSNLGRVRSLDRFVERGNKGFFKEGQIQKLQNNGNGYLYKQLKYKGKHRNFYIHRLVLMVFVGERPDGMVICHKDGDITNNKLSNLRYDTPSENNIDQFRQGSRKNVLKIEEVLKIRKMYKEGYRPLDISKKLNINIHSVRSVAHGKSYSWLNDDGTIQESKTQIKL